MSINRYIDLRKSLFRVIIANIFSACFYTYEEQFYRSRNARDPEYDLAKHPVTMIMFILRTSPASIFWLNINLTFFFFLWQLLKVIYYKPCLHNWRCLLYFFYYARIFNTVILMKHLNFDNFSRVYVTSLLFFF